MDAAATHWWESIARRRLEMQHCATCDVVQHPPGPLCRTCKDGAALEWRPHPGTGRLVSFTEVLQSTYPELEVPYWIAMIELAPGAVLVSNLVGGSEVRPRIGDAVHLTYTDRGGVTLPVFALTEQEVSR